MNKNKQRRKSRQPLEKNPFEKLVNKKKQQVEKKLKRLIETKQIRDQFLSRKDANLKIVNEKQLRIGGERNKYVKVINYN